MLRIVPFVVAILCFITYSHGFNTPSKHKFTTNLFSVAGPNSYLRLRELAQQAKNSQASGNVPQPNVVKVEQTVQVATISQMDEPEEDEEPSNGLPFTDSMYDNFKYVIGKITNRVKSNTVLTLEEVDRFEKSAHAIIRDAKSKAGLLNTATTSYPQTTATQSQELEEAIIPTVVETGDFNSIKGKGSTWRVEGMEYMTTDEYYEALNKRNAQLRAARRQQDPNYSRNAADDYLASLSRKRE